MSRQYQYSSSDGRIVEMCVPVTNLVRKELDIIGEVAQFCINENKEKNQFFYSLLGVGSLLLGACFIVYGFSRENRNERTFTSFFVLLAGLTFVCKAAIFFAGFEPKVPECYVLNSKLE